MFYKGINLRTATIHDFTNDPKILVDEFGIDEPKDTYTKHIPVETRIWELLEYADLTNNKELENAVSKAFKNELDTFGFE